MKNLLTTYRLIEIDNPFERWSDPKVRTLFERTMTLKFAAYGRKYPSGVVPVDTYSWIASHYLVCRGENDPAPVMILNRTSLQQCQRHFLPFPVLSAFKQVGTDFHVRELERLLSRYEHAPDQVSYIGGFTIDPSLKTNRPLVEELKLLMVAIQYLMHIEQGEDHVIITAPTVRFRIDALFEQFGFVPFPAGCDTPILALPSFAGERVLFMQGKQFNEQMLELADKYRPLWQKRAVISGRALDDGSGETFRPASESAATRQHGGFGGGVPFGLHPELSGPVP